MATAQQLRRLATHPRDQLKHLATGKLPQGVQPKSPLIELLLRIRPADLARIEGVTVDERLGYRGSREFATAAQALRWARPSAEVFGTFPADAALIRARPPDVSLARLKECSRRFPEELLRRYSGRGTEALSSGPAPRRA